MKALIGAGLVSGVLLAASFPPHGIPWLAWISALVPWMVALARRGGPRLREAIASAVALSVALHVVTCTWMVHVMRVHGGLSWPLALVTYAIGALTVTPYAVPAALVACAWTRRAGGLALLAAVPAWTLVDIARGHMVLGFPWYLPGMTQADHVAVLGVADLGGVHAVTALVLVGNVLVSCIVLAALDVPRRKQAMAGALVAASLLAAGLGYGGVEARRHAVPSAASLRVAQPAEGDVDGRAAALDASWQRGGDVLVALVQGAVPQEVVIEARPDEDEARAKLEIRLTGAALDAGADLVVWSESSYPASFAVTWPAHELRLRLSREHGPGRHPEVVAGGLADEWTPKGGRAAYTPTNSAVVFDEHGPVGRYDKRYLVPFGEYLPAPWLFVWFEKITKTVGAFRAGSSEAPIASAHGALGTFVCYEAVLGDHVRSIAANGAELLVNVTNDGWFHGTSLPEQHLRFGVLRAIETRRWMLRCANSGISAVIAPDGRIVGRMEEGERGVLLSSVSRGSERTVYVAVGDAPLVALGSLVVFAACATLIARALEQRDARRAMPAPR